ncbi:MAG: NERD domain-containing protein [Acidimicrobiales bacterium]|nr:NERD domain-containing protein [Acidimicrobiales bacterium]
MAAKITSLRFGGTCSVCGTSIEKKLKAWWDPNTHIVKCLTCFEPDDSNEANPEIKEAFVMRLRFGGTCSVCGTSIEKKLKAWWDPEVKTLTCAECKAIVTIAEPGDQPSHEVLQESVGLLQSPAVGNEPSGVNKVNLVEMQLIQSLEMQEAVKETGEQNVSFLSHERIPDERRNPDPHYNDEQVDERGHVNQPMIEHTKSIPLPPVPLLEEMLELPVDSILPPLPPLILPNTIGVAGASARREYERRHQKREAKIDEKWGRLSGVVKFFSDDPQSTQAWAKGSEGERKLAAGLARRAGDRMILLHDCRVPKTRGNIDHIAVASSGVWVIDAKSYKGMVEKRDVGGWFTTDFRLYVGGRDRTKLAKGLQWQVEAVRNALGIEHIPINAALCFVDAEWRLFGKPFQIEGTWVTWGAKLSEMIADKGPLGRGDVIEIATHLTKALPPNEPGNPS